MVEQSDLLKYALNVLEQLEIPYAIVGSFACGVWGESRFTQDIDILLNLRSDLIAPLCAEFPPPHFCVSNIAAREAVARSGHFNVLHPSSGNKIDFMIADERSWTGAQLDRRIMVPLFPDQPAAFAAPEDVILGKLVYFRQGGSDKHLRDIAGILQFSGELIDFDYLRQQTRLLGLDKIWESIVAKSNNDN